MTLDPAERDTTAGVPPARALRVTLAARGDQVDAARRAAAAFARGCGFGGRLGDIGLAVSEVFTNAVVRAYRAGAAGHVELSATSAGGRLSITIRDSGTGVAARFDSPGLGMGLALASQAADTFRVDFAPGGGAEAVIVFHAD